MKLPSHPLPRLASWCALVYLSVDLVVAIRGFSAGQADPMLPAAHPTRPSTLNSKWPGELFWMLSVRSQPDPLPTSAQTSAGSAGIALEQLPPPRLLATLQGSGQRLALLQLGADSQVLGVKEAWKGFLVLEVDDLRVRLRAKNGRELVITMPMADRPSAQQTPEAPVVVAQTVSRPVSSSVKQLSLKRQQIQQWFSAKDAASGSALGPYKRNEQVVGIQVNYITPESPYAKLGIKSGDAITSLNGRPVLSAEDMRWLQQEIVTAPSLQFQLDRDGQSQAHQIQVQP